MLIAAAHRVNDLDAEIENLKRKHPAKAAG
jgi:hypothetical protein